MHPHGYRIVRALCAVLLLSLPAAADAMDAVLIGNGTYTNPVWSNLACSSNDVTLMDARLKSALCSFATTTYLDQTAPQIANAVNLGIPAIPNDTWIFYYTGHGDNTNGYSGGLAGVSDNGSGSDLYYPKDFAAQLASVGHPFSTAVLLDACGSGGFAKLADTFLQAKNIPVLFLTATDDSLNCAVCGGGGTSNFTFWVNKGLSGLADGACGGLPNGVVTFDELDCYLTTNYDPLGVKHLYIPRGLGSLGCRAVVTAVRRSTWGDLKQIYR